MTGRDQPISTHRRDTPHFRSPAAHNHLLYVTEEQITWLDRTFGCEHVSYNDATNSIVIAVLCSKVVGVITIFHYYYY